MAGFLIELALHLGELETFDLAVIYRLLIVPSLVAGLVALGKALREYAGSNNYTALVDKLPF